MERQHLSKTKKAIASSNRESAIARSSTHPIEELQGAIGNRAVNQLLTNQPVVQAKPMFRGLSHELTGELQQSEVLPPAQGSGKTMPEAVQQKMETAFSTDFSNVRIHEGLEAESIGAIAYTHGRDIHFAPGKYNPTSQTGQKLLGHELTHVVQQQAGQVAAPQGKGIPINADSRFENEADVLGTKAAQGETANVTGLSSGIQCKGSEKGKGVIQRVESVSEIRKKFEAPVAKERQEKKKSEEVIQGVESVNAIRKRFEALVEKESQEREEKKKSEEKKEANRKNWQKPRAASSSGAEQNKAKNNEERKEYKPDRSSAINKDIAALKLEVGDSPERGVKWKRELQGLFGYQIEDETTYKASRLEEICQPGVAHSELWWANRGIQLPNYIAQEVRPETTGDEYVYHITDQRWLKNIGAGFKSLAARNGGRKIAEETGSTKVYWQKNQKTQITSTIESILKKLLLEDKQKAINEDYFNMAIEVIKKTKMDNMLPHAISVFEEMEGVDEDRDSNLLNANYEIGTESYKVKLSDELSKKLQSIQQTPTAKLKLTPVKNILGKLKAEAKNIYEMEDHYLTRVAKNYREAKNAIEEMVTSQHIYVFTSNKISETLNAYGSLKKHPVVIRIPIGAFKFLGKDTQSGAGFRSRDEVPGDCIQYYEPVGDNTKKLSPEVFLKENFSDNGNSKKDDRWKPLP